jgi:antitoxin component of MazEF toxin-antitoxin module
MYKKLTKHGNSLAIVIDKPILRMLKIDGNSNIDLRIEGNQLIIKKGKPGKARAEGLILNERKVDQIAKKILKKYSPLFEKLAKK